MSGYHVQLVGLFKDPCLIELSLLIADEIHYFICGCLFSTHNPGNKNHVNMLLGPKQFFPFTLIEKKKKKKKEPKFSIFVAMQVFDQLRIRN